MYGDSVVPTVSRDERAFARDDSTLWKDRAGESLSFIATARPDHCPEVTT